jgi:hypothetical protein
MASGTASATAAKALKKSIAFLFIDFLGCP